jgi:hypothetical protein
LKRNYRVVPVLKFSGRNNLARSPPRIRYDGSQCEFNRSGEFMTKIENLYRLSSFLTHAAVAALLITPVAFAQQQTNSDPYQGVAQPPPDDSIVASPDEPQPAPHEAAKPSPAVPATAPASTSAAAPAPASSYTAAPATNSSSSHYDNTDYGIVTSVPGQSEAPVTSNAAPPAATLQTRENSAYDADIVNVVPSPANELAEGTVVRVRLREKLSTKETSAGAPFGGEVTANIYKDGRIIIPAGSTMKGRVVSVRQGHHFTGAATLRLRPDVIILPDGTAYHLYAQVIGSQASGTRTDSEGGIQPKSQLVKNTVEYGIGAGTGALVGAQVGGPPGALVGGLIGAGVITTHLLLQHPAAAVVPEGSVLTFSLTEPMELTPTRN